MNNFISIQQNQYHLTNKMSMSIAMMRLRRMDDMNERRTVLATSSVSLLLYNSSA